MNEPVGLDELVELWMVRRDGDGENGGQHPRRHLAQLLARDVLLHLSGQLKSHKDG